MNWREFTDLTAAMAEGRTESNAATVNRALNKQTMAYTAYCWHRFSSTCATAAPGAHVPRPTAPSPWLPPLI